MTLHWQEPHSGVERRGGAGDGERAGGCGAGGRGEAREEGAGGGWGGTFLLKVIRRVVNFSKVKCLRRICPGTLHTE